MQPTLSITNQTLYNQLINALDEWVKVEKGSHPFEKRSYTTYPGICCGEVYFRVTIDVFEQTGNLLKQHNDELFQTSQLKCENESLDVNDNNDLVRLKEWLRLVEERVYSCVNKRTVTT